MKRVSLECGGKSPHIVLADCRRPRRGARRAAAWGVFFNQGEVCNAGSRARRARADQGRVHGRCCRGRGASIAPGDPLDPDTTLGAIVDETQTERVLGYIDAGRDEGADARARRQPRARGQRRLLRRADRVRRRAQRHDDRARGDLRPGAGDDRRSAPRTRRSRVANDTIYGLAAAVWTRQRRRARTASRARSAPASCGSTRSTRGDITEPVRRLQAVRHRPRQVAARVRQVHRAEDDLDRVARLAAGQPGPPSDRSADGRLPRTARRARSTT